VSSKVWKLNITPEYFCFVVSSHAFPEVIEKTKNVQDRTVFVDFNVFFKKGCERHIIFMKGVPASKTVGNI